MKENKLVDLSMDIAVDIVACCKSIKGSSVLINQVLRSGTSIGANIHEANYAQSKPDFISKLHIALKECYETEYWHELLVKTSIISIELAHSLKNKCGTIRRILVASVNTAKSDKL